MPLILAIVFVVMGILFFGHMIGRHAERTNALYEAAVADGLDPELAAKSTTPGWLLALTVMVFLVGAWEVVQLTWKALVYWL